MELTIFDTAACSYLDILNTILNESDELKEVFITNRKTGMAWIPGPGGINLEKGIGSCTGDLLEKESVLGPFIALSFLPNTISLSTDSRFKKTSEKVDAEIKQAKS